MTHTKRPWKARIHRHSGVSDTVCIKHGDDEIVHWAGFDGVPCTKQEIRANARRIVACVNALEGLDIATIEAGLVKELVEAAKALLAGSERHIFGGECLTERDVMRAALAKIGGCAMTDYVEYKPPANGVAPRGWQNGMAWDIGPFDIDCFDASETPYWEEDKTFRVPPTALHYPIGPYEGELGADIAVNGRPEWLPDGQYVQQKWNDELWHNGASLAKDVLGWNTVTKIRLPASHGYYADNLEGSAGIPVDVTEWLRANLPAIQAAGHSVTFAPDWAEQLSEEIWHIASGPKNEAKPRIAAVIRSRVRLVL